MLSALACLILPTFVLYKRPSHVALVLGRCSRHSALLNGDCTSNRLVLVVNVRRQLGTNQLALSLRGIAYKAYVTSLRQNPTLSLLPRTTWDRPRIDKLFARFRMEGRSLWRWKSVCPNKGVCRFKKLFVLTYLH